MAVSLTFGLCVLPLLLVAAVLVVWLFPYGEGYKHYEGMGEQPAGYKSWDEMTKAEKEDSASRMFK